MTTFFITFGILFLIIFAIFILGCMIVWSSHINMTKRFTKRYGYASLNEFIYQFNKVKDWQFRGYGNDSIESYSNKETYFCNDIISFEGDGMILKNLFSYLFALKIFKTEMKNLEYGSKLVPLRWRIMGRSK